MGGLAGARGLFFFRVVVTLCLLGFISASVSFDDLLVALLGAELSWLFLAVVVWLINQALVTFRWAILLHPFGYRIPFRYLLRSTMLGHFANYFTPGEWGVEATWIATLFYWTKERINPTLSIVMDKVLTLIGTGTIGFLSVIVAVDYGLIETPALDHALLASFFLISFFACLVSLFFYLFKGRGRGVSNKTTQVINSISEGIHTYRDHRESVIWSLLVGIVSRTITVIFIWALGGALGINASILIFFITVPVILLMSSIPLSIYNIGVKEGLYVFFLTKFGVSAEQALGLGLFVTAWSLVSGIACSAALIAPAGAPTRGRCG